MPLSTASRGQRVPNLPVVISISLPPPSPPVPARCSRPKDVANAHIDVGGNTLLNARLRYTCNPGYKRKAGTSSLIQCILREGSTEPDWTHTTLQCIRKSSLGSRDAMGTGKGEHLHHRRDGGGCRVAWALPLMVSPCCVFPKGTRLYLRKPPALSSRPRRAPRGRPRGVRKGQTQPTGVGLRPP